MYIIEHATEKEITLTIDLHRITHDAANADELSDLMRMVYGLCIEAAALDAALRRKIAPF